MTDVQKIILTDIEEAQKNLTTAADRLKVGLTADVEKSVRLAEVLVWRARQRVGEALSGQPVKG